MKKTAIDWAPNIPDNWQEVRLKDIARLQSGNGITSDDIDEIGDYPVYGGNGMRGYTDSYTNCGDYVLIGRQGALCGNINYATGCFYASEHAVVVYPYAKKESVTWLGETLRTANLNRLSSSAAQPGLAVGTINRIMIPLPPKEERERIGHYLDEKTSAIDKQIELLDKKQKLYARLKSATINRAVTRGLDENVKLKDSGVDWIGMIPEHWNIKRFKEFAKTIKGKQSEYFDFQYDGMATVLTVETLRQDHPVFLNYGIITDKKQLCDEKDIVVIWDGAGVGEFLRAKEGILSSTIAKIEVNEKKMLRDYLWQWRYHIEYYLKSIPTGMGIPHLNPNLLNNYKIPVPQDLEEQYRIASYLNERCAKIDAAIAIIDKQTDALRRLKKSLINEVVTGQRAV